MHRAACVLCVLVLALRTVLRHGVANLVGLPALHSCRCFSSFLVTAWLLLVGGLGERGYRWQKSQHQTKQDVTFSVASA